MIWPLGSLTLKLALGRASVTTPSNSITSSLGRLNHPFRNSIQRIKRLVFRRIGVNPNNQAAVICFMGRCRYCTSQLLPLDFFTVFIGDFYVNTTFHILRAVLTTQLHRQQRLSYVRSVQTASRQRYEQSNGRGPL